MTSPGTWRVRTSTCAYLLITSTIIAAGATFSVTTSESAVLVAAAEQPTKKIGPGRTSIPPIDFGKPEQVVSITPYVSRAPSASVQRPKRDVPRAAPAAASPVTSAALVNTPLIIVTVARPEYRAPDIHRVY